jgi:ankyrin repeat protein
VKVLNKKTELALATLLKAKVNTSLKNKNGESALDLAKKINAEAVKILVKNGIK